MSDEMNLDLAPAWRPLVGEVLVGVVTEVSRGWSDQAEKYYPIVSVRPEKPARIITKGKSNDSTDPKDFEYTNEPVAIHAFHTVLYNRLVELQPIEGERLGVKYTTESVKDKKKGNTPAVYNVKIDGRGVADVWSAMNVDPRLAAAKQRNAGATVTPNVELSDGVDTSDDDDIPF